MVAVPRLEGAGSVVGAYRPSCSEVVIIMLIKHYDIYYITWQHHLWRKSVLISKDLYHEMIMKSGAFTLRNMHSILDKYL